jgi:hypothetical protein
MSTIRTGVPAQVKIGKFFGLGVYITTPIAEPTEKIIIPANDFPVISVFDAIGFIDLG